MLSQRLSANWFVNQVLLAPLEPILHDSPFRIRIFAFAVLLGEPLYFFVWTFLLPQPAESVFLRASAVLMAFPLVFTAFHQRMGKQNLGRYWVALCFFALPYFFLCLYAMNGFNVAWTSSCVAMIYLLFVFTDWRVALAELFLSIPLVVLTFATGLLELPSGSALMPSPADLVIFGFALATATPLAMSAANLRRERARSALITMGVLAHEFRTPLAAAGLLADTLEDELSAEPTLLPVVRRLRTIFSSMHSQIDYQMRNARLMDMPRERSVADIGDLVIAAVNCFPFSGRPMRELALIKVESGLLSLVHKDMMIQVIHNLLSNAAKALARKGDPLARSDISILVSRHRPGTIQLKVIDRGDGIPTHMLEKVFEPFETSSHMPSHGLGLTMCKNAVTSFGGEVWCQSTIGQGTTFIVELPEATPAQIQRSALAR